ncbi:MAG TPA: penicillin-binding protein 1C [Polyangia bacterium]|nr:penicillin-binding protein 1C [Polyangia bacterium]
MEWRRIPKWRRRLAVLLSAWLAVKVLLVLWPHRPLAERYGSSLAVYDANHKLLRLTLAEDGQYRLWTPLKQISPALVEATLLYEDKHFYHHYAFNPISLVRAAWATYVGGGRRIGGSTISMQLARRLYNIPSRTFWGKVRQIGRAVQLEMQYSKDDILEAYLNLVPYGGNVEGVGAASQIYFGKPAQKLLLPEALTMAVIPQSPSRRAGFLAHANESKEPLLAARTALFESWVQKHPEARKDWEPLIKLPIVMREASDLPFLAPHFVDEVLAAEHAPREVQTTLDLGLQKLVERHARSYVAQKERIGIHNAVVMLADYRTMEIKAMLGSVDFRDDAIAGQVNGALAKRSPGSTLKPFVYALGMEQGVIHPQTMLRDAPMSFAAFSPENFDGRFVGPLSAKDALIRSRNIPALAVAAKLNRPGLYEFLKTAGVSRMQPESHYGLGLVLGAGEVTMEELVTLYATLANRGVLKPLRYRAEEPSSDGTRILSEESSFMVLDMLKDNPRPDRSRADDFARGRVPVYWKTGTSYGFRDAWAVGIFGPYVLAVWIGNFNGEGNPAFIGAQAAAPLFFEIVDSIYAQDRSIADWPLAVPKGVKRVSVCTVSGQLPSASCPHQKPSWFIPGRSPIEVCQIHRPVVIDDRTGKRACPPYRGPTHEEVYEIWSSDMQQLFAAAGLPRRKVPPPAPGCGEGETPAGIPPRITSPLRGVTYTLQKSRPESIALQAVTDGDAHEVFWFVGEAFVGKAKSGSPLFWTPRPGAYVVRAVDDLSRSDARELKVELAQ